VIARLDACVPAELHPSPNIEPRRNGARPDILLLHYTGMLSGAKAVAWLADPRSRVSCHYVVDDDGTITQMVAEAMRAWHAGAGSWEGRGDVNSRSIGIEIHNRGHDLGYADFPPVQMQAVTALCRDIIARHGIAPHRVLAHSDIAPDRKKDPGEKFDWAGLAAAGVGHWVEPASVTEAGVDPDSAGIARAQRLLADYGYGIAVTGVADEATRNVVIAFQRHFRPARVDGVLDGSTIDMLERLSAARTVC
jgi:N-acetylmuramoyl-L-alanine amidase